MGITSAPEVYARMMSQLVDHIPGVAVLLDDICVSGSTKKEHDDRLTAVLKILEKNGVTLNAEKCQFDKTKIRYLGYIVDADGIQPDEEKIRAIKEYPAPKDITQLRRFLGMVNHLGKFLENLADKTQPLRELLNKKNAWICGKAQEKAFQSLIKVLQTPKILKHFENNEETMLSTDACKSGLGAVLYQKNKANNWQPVAYASRTLAPAEKNNAIIEK